MILYMSELLPNGKPLIQEKKRVKKQKKYYNKRSFAIRILKILSSEKTILQISTETKICQNSVRRVLSELNRDGLIEKFGAINSRTYRRVGI